MNNDYSIGLDIGNTSVGWAVIGDDNQKVLKKGKEKNRKTLWGVRLFEEAKTAADRRNFRSSRRRYERRRWRISLLRDIFSAEINKVDQNFYTKMNESFYNENDSLNKSIKISKDEKIAIKKYNEKYRTIYHLRKRLVEDDNKEDIRLVYLAIHHIIKYRGNFLFNFKNFSVNSLNLSQKLRNVFENIGEFLNIDVSILNYDEISTAMLNKSKNDVKVEITNLLKDKMSKDFINEFIKLIVGNKFDFNKMLLIEGEEKVKLSFNGSEFDDKFDEFANALGDNIEILESLKELYDMLFLKKLFKSSDHTTLSSLMVEKYEIHKKDLKFLKTILDYNRKEYNKILRSNTSKCIYEKYLSNDISKDDFYKEINNSFQKIFDNITDEKLINIYNTDIQKRISEGSFMPKITDVDNGKFPYQLNKDELLKIIEKQGQYYPFLLEKTDDGKNKIVQLLEFKIPYYVGPLVSDEKSNFAWMEKTKDEKITPYNFEEVVDKEKTAEKFIKRMISHCTYFLDELALPNNSILYSTFKVINELKQIRVNNHKLDIEVQKNIMNDLFKKRSGTITDKIFKKYINNSSDFSMYSGSEVIITGYSADLKFANNMQSYYDFFGDNGIFLGTNYTIYDADLIIEWITVFEDKDILETKIRKNYNLSETAIKKVLNKKYKGWGSLSKKFLTEKYYYDESVGVKKSILDLMEETEENFMQILNNDKYKFQDMIKEHNNILNINKINYSVVSDLATSPATKRGIYQALKVVKEIVDFMGYEPKYISIEMARENTAKKRTKDRKKYISDLYKEFKKEINNYGSLMEELNKEEKLDSEKLFLYFIQEGKSLYSGTPLKIEDLNEYEVDHIIPRTLIKDDSIENKALVLRKENQIKSSNYVLPSIYRTEFNKKWWEHLKKVGLISAKKFHNLIRSKYSDEDINGFINRQLVETRQITKHVANILENFYKNTKVIYLKANLSHNYRERYELFKFRDINDFHHAHDAYLAAVLGEYKEEHLLKKIDYNIIKELNNQLIENGDFKKLKYGFVINSLDSDVNEKLIGVMKNYYDKETGEILFDSERFNNTIINTLYNNDVLISKKVEFKTGEFYNQTKNKKGLSGVPLKKNLDTSKYGSYTSLNPAYALMVTYNSKNKVNKRLIGVPIYYVELQKNNSDLVEKYVKRLLNLKEDDSVKIDEKKIPFYSYLNWDGQLCYLVGASDKVEVINAKEFYFEKRFYIEHKYTLQKLFNNKKIEIEDEKYKKQIEEIIIYIVDKIKKEYKLYENLVDDLKNMINYNNLSVVDIENKEKIIIELLNLLKCNSKTANFKFLNNKYSSAFGKKNGRIISNAIIKSTNTTGLRGKEYEL